MEGRITTPPTMSGVRKRKAEQSRRHIEAIQSKTMCGECHHLLSSYLHYQYWIAMM
jgi:hypothetical protein